MSQARRIRLLAVLAALLSTVMIVAAAPSASANNPLPTGSNLRAFVNASAPNWNFARANNHDSCWPSDPLPGGNQSSAATLKPWPVAGQGGCPDRWSNFPTFYSAKKCNATEVRVSYSIFFKKNGFSPGKLGHAYDFERIVVVWKKSGNNWYRDRLLLSRHGGYATQQWGTAESWNGSKNSAGLGREFPRIFVGWGSHAMFNHQGGLKDVASQYTNNEYRHADYSTWASNWLVETTPQVAAQFNRYNWGKANTTPAVIGDRLCSV